jgi:hypothetical protein
VLACCQHGPHFGPGPIALPAAQPAIAGLPWPEPLGHIAPRCAGVQLPHDPAQDLPVIPPRLAAPAVGGQQRLHASKRLIGELPHRLAFRPIQLDRRDAIQPAHNQLRSAAVVLGRHPPCPRMVRSARQRRRATDRCLTERAEQLDCRRNEPMATLLPSRLRSASIPPPASRPHRTARRASQYLHLKSAWAADGDLRLGSLTADCLSWWCGVASACPGVTDPDLHWRLGPALVDLSPVGVLRTPPFS